MTDTTITPKVVDAAVWALLGYSKPPHASNANFPDVDWNIQRTWHLSDARKQVTLALKAASDIFATEQAAEVARLRNALTTCRAEAIQEAADACTNVIKKYDVMKPDGKTYESLKMQKAAKGMVSLARRDIEALASKP